MITLKRPYTVQPGADQTIQFGLTDDNGNAIDVLTDLTKVTLTLRSRGQELVSYVQEPADLPNSDPELSVGPAPNSLTLELDAATTVDWLSGMLAAVVTVDTEDLTKLPPYVRKRYVVHIGRIAKNPNNY
jgi:hypothetical protein